MVKEAKKRKTIEIDESLSKLDGKVVTFPKCNDTNALTQARIGEVSELGLDDYRLDVVGNKDVLPKRNWFEVRKDNPKTPEDKKRQWTCYLVTHAKEDTPAMEAPVLRFVITGGTLSAMWTESARSVPNYPSSNQAPIVCG